jgi:hypothetical protein
MPTGKRMAGHPKEWLHPMLKSWAEQYVRARNGYRTFADGTRHFDGWPVATVLAKIREDGEGAGQGMRRQSYAEVYAGDGLTIWRAMDGMRIDLREVLYARYLSRQPIRQQAQNLGLGERDYFRLLDNAFHYLEGRISAAIACKG